MKLTDLKVEKARSFLKLGNDNWIIDFYKGANKGLVTAEIELKSEDEQVLDVMETANKRGVESENDIEDKLIEFIIKLRKSR